MRMQATAADYAAVAKAKAYLADNYPKTTARRVERQTVRARHIQRNLGTRCAAGYLRNKGWSLEGALCILVYSTITG